MIHALLITALLGVTPIHQLIDDKRWDEAESQLDSVSPVVRPRFEGLIAQGRGNLQKAVIAFEQALENTPKQPRLHLYASHAYLEMKYFSDALRHAETAKALSDESLAQALLEARALEGLNRKADAYSILARACERFPKKTRPWLELAALAYREDLREDVRRAAEQIMARNPERSVATALFHLLYRDPEALPMLEQLAARYQYDAKMRSHLGHVYAEKRRWFAAARLFEEATMLGDSHAFEAADQYWLAGLFQEALRMNALAPKSIAQQIQRVAILFEAHSYARIVAMAPTLNDPATIYRVAYSHYAIGDHSRAADQARSLLKTSYREAAISLLHAMGRTETEIRAQQ